MQLHIGNKNYSSWSMRPWVLMREFGIPFEEVKHRFDSFEPGSRFKTSLAAITPTGTVPVLVDEGFSVWDTLAIAEYLAEKFPARQLWPADARARARARSVCAEMHAGFSGLRGHFGMNIEASLPEVGERVLATQPEARANLERIVSMWSELLRQHGGPMLFGSFSIADAYFAPVAMRIRTYALPVPEELAAYVGRLSETVAVSAWIQDALAEKDFLPFEEPYRTQV